MGSVTVLLTDIEGTTTSLSFVKDVLFGYALDALPAWCEAHRDDEDLAAWMDEARHEADDMTLGFDQVVDLWCAWIRADRKATSLKAVQGRIWADGYAAGAFTGHLYPDAAEQLVAWRHRGLRLYVFSSGSVEAQRLLFGHTAWGDLNPLFSGNFDTRTGPKRDPVSYAAIAAALGVEPQEVLFLSDVVEELDAALAAGLRTTWVVREGALPESARHPVVRDFTGIIP